MRYAVLTLFLMLGACGLAGKLGSGFTTVNGKLVKLEKPQDSEIKKVFMESDSMEELSKGIARLELKEIKKNPNILQKLNMLKRIPKDMMNTENVTRTIILGKEYYYMVLSDIIAWQTTGTGMLGYAYQKVPEYEMVAIIAHYIGKSYEAWKAGDILRTDMKKNRLYWDALTYFLKKYDVTKQVGVSFKNLVKGGTCSGECAQKQNRQQSAAAIANLGGSYAHDIASYSIRQEKAMVKNKVGAKRKTFFL